MRNYKSNKGFTLIELLVVIGILAVLLAITLIAINPARQFAQANNTKRSSDVNAILNAIGQYAADNNGDLSGLAIPATATDIGNNTGEVNLCTLVPTYIAELPADPVSGDPDSSISQTECTSPAVYNTGYTVSQSATDQRITVAAPDAELSSTISVTR